MAKTIFHIIPFPLSQLNKIKQLPHASLFEKLKGHAQEQLQKIIKDENATRKAKPALTHSKLLWLDSERVDHNLFDCQSIPDGAILVFHGHGNPGVLGVEEETPYDLYPHTLAKLIDKFLAQHPHIQHLTIRLLSCNTASTIQKVTVKALLEKAEKKEAWKIEEKLKRQLKAQVIDTENLTHEINFAQNVSYYLGALYPDKRIIVEGFTGYIAERDKGYYCAATQEDEGRVHLEQAQASYCGGTLVTRAETQVCGQEQFIFPRMPYYIGKLLYGQHRFERARAEGRLTGGETATCAAPEEGNGGATCAAPPLSPQRTTVADADDEVAAFSSSTSTTPLSQRMEMFSVVFSAAGRAAELPDVSDVTELAEFQSRTSAIQSPTPGTAEDSFDTSAARVLTPSPL